jgi:hypothetical protein
MNSRRWLRHHLRHPLVDDVTLSLPDGFVAGLEVRNHRATRPGIITMVRVNSTIFYLFTPDEYVVDLVALERRYNLDVLE